MGNTIMSFREIEEYLECYNNHLVDYDLSKPLVTTLELLGWGKSANLILCFSQGEVGFKTSVFFNNDYSARDGSLSFRNLCPGVQIELLLSITRKGYINVENAKIVGFETPPFFMPLWHFKH